MSGFLVNKLPLDPTVTQYSGGTTSFTLPQVGSTNSTEVYVGGVPQVAGVDFNVAGTALTLTTSAPAGSNMVCARQYFSDGITGTAGANTVATAAIQNDSVTGGKLNPALVAGDIIYADGTDTINRLAKGAASQTLAMNSGASAPEWITPAAGGGYEFVSKTEPTTSDTNLIFTMAAGYNYMWEFYEFTCESAYRAYEGLLGIDASTYRTSSYFNRFYSGTATTWLTANTGNLDVIGVDGTIWVGGDGTESCKWARVEVFCPNDADTYTSMVSQMIVKDNSANEFLYDQFGHYGSKEAHSHIKFYWNTGDHVAGTVIHSKRANNL
jgi:hypothetical protein